MVVMKFPRGEKRHSHLRSFFSLLAIFLFLPFTAARAEYCPDHVMIETNNDECPVCVTGTVVSCTQVNLSWDSVANADHYEMWRSDLFPNIFLLTTTTQTNYSDTTVQADKAYLYQIRAVDSAGHVLSISNWDLVTTVIFADDPLTPLVTPVQTVHITDLRKAVNAVRTLSGLSAALWTYSNVSGQPIRAVDIDEIRTQLAQALLTLNLPVPWTGSISAGMTVSTTHFQPVRQAVK